MKLQLDRLDDVFFILFLSLKVTSVLIVEPFGGVRRVLFNGTGSIRKTSQEHLTAAPTGAHSKCMREAVMENKA